MVRLWFAVGSLTVHLWFMCGSCVVRWWLILGSLVVRLWFLCVAVGSPWVVVGSLVVGCWFASGSLLVPVGCCWFGVEHTQVRLHQLHQLQHGFLFERDVQHCRLSDAPDTSNSARSTSPSASDALRTSSFEPVFGATWYRLPALPQSPVA